MTETLLPMDETTLGIALSLFTKVAVATTGILTLIVTIRIVLLSLQFSGAQGYAEVFRGAIAFFWGIQLFPLLLRAGVQTTGALAAKLAFTESKKLDGPFFEFLKVVGENFTFIQFMNVVGPYIIPRIAQSVSTLFLSVLIAIAPVVMLIQTLLGLDRALKSFFAILVSLCLWPVLWNLLGSLANAMWGGLGATSFQGLIFWFVVALLQLGSPLFCMALFRSFEFSSPVKRGFQTGGRLTQHSILISQSPRVPLPKNTSYKKGAKRS